jgi:hypothetical protein
MFYDLPCSAADPDVYPRSQIPASFFVPSRFQGQKDSRIPVINVNLGKYVTTDGASYVVKKDLKWHKENDQEPGGKT